MQTDTKLDFSAKIPGMAIRKPAYLINDQKSESTIFSVDFAKSAIRSI